MIIYQTKYRLNRHNSKISNIIFLNYHVFNLKDVIFRILVGQALRQQFSCVRGSRVVVEPYAGSWVGIVICPKLKGPNKVMSAPQS